MLSVRFRRLEMLIFRKILGTYNVGPKSENTHLANPKRFRHDNKPLDGEPCNNS